jgi:hypothetical protein
MTWIYQLIWIYTVCTCHITSIHWLKGHTFQLIIIKVAKNDYLDDIVPVIFDKKLGQLAKQMQQRTNGVSFCKSYSIQVSDLGPS